MTENVSHHLRMLDRHAFSLVELVVVILILGVLAGVAAPRFLDASSDATTTAIVANVKLIFDAAERYAAEHGRLPVNSDNGEFPAELEGYLPHRLFTQPSPIGDPYDWNGPGTGMPHFGVSIQLPRGARAQEHSNYHELEAAVDDGDPNTGWVRAETDFVIFVLDES